MAMYCAVCSRRYPDHAQYCALCGRDLIAARTSPDTRNLGLITAVMIVAATAFAVFSAAERNQKHKVPKPPLVKVDHDFDLPSDKADAVFALIAPSDIKVIVGRRKGGVRLNGTPREISVLADFIGLITCCAGESAESVQERINDARATGFVRQTYDLPKSKGKVLMDILAGSDVPVLVSGDVRHVTVEASPADQATIARVVDILRGGRL